MRVRINLDHELSSLVFFTSLSHFLILFGYKLFSMYYPLFLESKGFDFATIGTMYLLIYLTVGVVSPVVSKIIKARNPAIFMALGIFGYAVYSLGMIFSVTKEQFYVWQVFLGISSAVFYMASRELLMRAKSKSHDRDFAYFYSAPLYATFLAPVLGGIILWRYGFTEIFAASIVVYLLGVFFALRERTTVILSHARKKKKRLASLLREGKNPVFLILAFITLFSVGVYRSFFVIFLKEEFELSHGEIVAWVSLASLISIPLSWKIANFLENHKSEKNIILGCVLSGILAVMVALSRDIILLFSIYIAENASKLISQSGKSGFLTKMFRNDEENGAMLDTMLTSIGVASGAIVAGVISDSVGLRMTFMIDGAVLLIAVLLSLLFLKSGHATSKST